MKNGKRFAGESLPEDIQRLADQMNLDESQVPPWTIPAVQSQSAREFAATERPALLKEFARCIYGALPPLPQVCTAQVIEEDRNAFDGLATRREIELLVANNGLERRLNILLYLPNEQLRNGKPVPLFFGLNFRGNHASTRDLKVRFLVRKRYPTSPEFPARICDNRATEEQRGSEEGRWCHEKVLQAGYATATLCLWDIYPDHPDGFEDSVLRLFFDSTIWTSPQRPSGAISAWAWGISRALDVLLPLPEIDEHCVIVHGLSRLGKTALWAGANDPRISLAVSICSGTCGAKLSHRYFGEDFSWIKQWNPHWTVPAFDGFVNHDAEIPVDQHQLLGCIAPRKVYVASATNDVYADPKGEYLAARAAGQFYALYGLAGLENPEGVTLTDELPPADRQVYGNVGYFLRTGEHNFTPENWDALLDYVRRELRTVQ